MSGYLYFPSNLKDKKRPHAGFIKDRKIFIQQKVTVSKENMNL